MKNNRQLKILELISRTDVETQEELQALLRAEGVSATQATISRDIKELHLHKIPLETGGYKYALSSKTLAEKDEREKYRSVLSTVLTSAVPACNIAVIKPLTGTANAAAVALESMQYSEIIGTLAGDDTLLCLFATDRAAYEFCSKINSLYIKD